MVIQSFEDLRIWKETHALAKEIHQLVKKYPPEEKYEIVPQLRRASVSVPANIAEGFEREHTKEFINFLNIAKGSLGETRYYIILSYELGYLTEAEYRTLNGKCINLSKMIGGLIYKLKQKVEKK
jgi:four helix bundle protein